VQWVNLVISPASAPARIIATDKGFGKVVWETNVSDAERVSWAVSWAADFWR